MTKEEKEPAIPEQVEGARQTWRVTVVSWLLLATVATMTCWLHPEMLMSLSTAKENLPGFSEGQIDATVKASIVIAFSFAVGLCIVFFAIIERMRRGSEGAHTVLVIGSLYLALSALISFFSSTVSEAGVPTSLVLISGIVQITSATAVVIGLVLAASKESKGYFDHQRPSKPWTPSASESHLPRTSKHGADSQQQQRLDQSQPKQSKQPEGSKQ